MPKYKVKPGRSFSGFKEHQGRKVRHTFGSGDEVDLTPSQTIAFGDCFDLVEEPKRRPAKTPAEESDKTPAQKAAETRAKNKAAKEEAATAAEVESRAA